ncbi:MAG TPA: hypothetical protein VFQ22_11945 [Longimicrobiales bacterium]|nr:hypothetical protein [Longimicrobiales bacterium]
MDPLFSSRSIWTMIHGIALGGGALLALAAAAFAVIAMHPAPERDSAQSRHLARLSAAAAALLWATVIAGTYVTFPPYRATPPEGVKDLSAYPRELIRSDPETAWLHSFAMETKEHVPWIAAMLATAVAAVAVRYRGQMLADGSLRRISASVLALTLALVAGVSLLGVFINKVAPLE